MVYIKNTSREDQKYIAHLVYENSRYRLGVKTIAAGETVAIDIRSLRDGQIPDEEGEVIPADLARGQLRWTRIDEGETDSPAMIGRAEQVYEGRAMSSTYACQSCCGDVVVGRSISPSLVGVQVGQTVQMHAFEIRADCTGWEYQVERGASWKSTNEQVATVDDNEVTFIGGGQTTIKASWNSVVPSSTQCVGNPGFLPGPEPIGPTVCCTNRPLPQSVSTTVQVVNVSIEEFLGVGKDQTANVQVTINPSPTQGNVTLTLNTTSGTGTARFEANNSTTLTINQSTSVAIKGVTESSTADNLRLEASVGGQSVDTELFSVILVILSLRTSGSISSDNAARSAYNSILGSTNLGTFFSSGTGNRIWRTGVEIIGTVVPSNFTGMITIQREVTELRRYIDMTLEGSGGPFGDTSDQVLRDDNPRSGGSSGKVYDLDAPGIGTTGSAPIGRIVRTRVNFRQWATISGTDNRVSADLQWFSRQSIMKTSTGDVLRTDVPGDNIAGNGTTTLTWNLQ